MPAGAASARALWTPFPPARLPSKKIGDFFRAPLAPYRPRLSFVRGYRIEPDAERAWTRVASGEVDLTREVLLDRRPAPDPAGPPDATPLLVAHLASDEPEEVVAEVTASYPGLLVLTDLHYPGWIAEEGGRRLPILRADGWFRAVALPAGTHRVVFRYRPTAFYAGAGDLGGGAADPPRPLAPGRARAHREEARDRARAGADPSGPRRRGRASASSSEAS